MVGFINNTKVGKRVRGENSFIVYLRGAFRKKTEKVGLLDQPADPPPPRDLVQKNRFFF